MNKAICTNLFNLDGNKLESIVYVSATEDI